MYSGSIWWYYFFYAMENYGYHHWEAELFADEKTGTCLPISIYPKECPSIDDSCYVPREEVFPDAKKE